MMLQLRREIEQMEIDLLTIFITFFILAPMAILDAFMQAVKTHFAETHYSAAAKALVNAVESEHGSKKGRRIGDLEGFKNYESVKKLAACPPDVYKEVFQIAVLRWKRAYGNDYYVGKLRQHLISHLFNQPIALQANELEMMMLAIVSEKSYQGEMPSLLLNHLETHFESYVFTENFWRLFKKMVSSEGMAPYYSSSRAFSKIKKRIEILEARSKTPAGEAPEIFLDEGDGFGLDFNFHLKNLSQAERHGWFRLLKLFFKTNASAPPAKFLKEAGSLLEAQPFLKNDLALWLRNAGQAHGSPQKAPSPVRLQEHDWFCENNQLFLRGFVWTSLLLKDEDLPTVLSRFAWRCFKKVPGVGAPSQALGTACCYVLSRMDNPAGVAFLTGKVSESQCR